MIKAAAGIAIAVAFGFSPSSAVAQADVDQQLGSVHFETSCNEVAQRRFDRAMRYQHSFWYTQSKQIFEDVLKADPSCGMALWGVALSLWYNPHSPPPAPNLPLGLAAIQQAKAVGAKTQRERDYIDALAIMYTDHDKVPHGQRALAFTKAMEQLAARYPQDDEAQILYSIMLNATAPASDKTYAQQLKGAAILDPIAKRQPRHPGVIHYLIHLYDYPPIAEKGLEAANLYAKIAPAAPHAQHMPSHIYTRVGYWKESVTANTASVKAAKIDKEIASQMHGWDYMVYAHLQLGQDKEARVVVDEMVSAPGLNMNQSTGVFALAASTARYAVERGDWKAAAELTVRPSQFPEADAMTHFARALGAARSGNSAAAKAEVVKLEELRDKLTAAKSAYWAEQVDIQRQIAAAWVLHAEGKFAEALAAMSVAADAGDRTEKHVVNPGPLAPARELYGVMLLDRGMAKEALVAFEATKKQEPNRFHGFAGAGKAAAALDDKAKARENYQKLLALTAGSDANRPELAAARQFLASN